jgi:rRNA maturation RNase YbeY
MISFEAPTELAGTIASLPANLWQELLPADNQYVVSIHLLTEDEMQQLNRTTRSIDKPTDVLSFPLFENIAALPEHDAPLGDLFICLPCVDEAHLASASVSFTAHCTCWALTTRPSPRSGMTPGAP